MDVGYAISVIAAIVTLIGVLIAVRRWFGQHVIVIGRHDPSKPVVGGSLTMADVVVGIEILVSYAKGFAPDYVYGINRGGGIVGGWIAKQLGQPFVHLCAVNCDLALGHRVKQDGPTSMPSGAKILLVDDAKRKGEHMREAMAYLKRMFPDADIRRVVMLEMPVPSPGPEAEVFRPTLVEKAAFTTFDSRVLLPWDKDASESRAQWQRAA